MFTPLRKNRFLLCCIRPQRSAGETDGSLTSAHRQVQRHRQVYINFRDRANNDFWTYRWQNSVYKFFEWKRANHSSKLQVSTSFFNILLLWRPLRNHMFRCQQVWIEMCPGHECLYMYSRMSNPCICYTFLWVIYLLSITGCHVVVGEFLMIIVLIIKILQSFLFLKFTELKHTSINNQ